MHPPENGTMRQLLQIMRLRPRMNENRSKRPNQIPFGLIQTRAKALLYATKLPTSLDVLSLINIDSVLN